MTRSARLVLSLALVAALNVAPPAVSPAAAVDCSAVSCAWLEIILGNGAGSGSAEVTVVALDTGEILSTHRTEPDKGYWRDLRRDPGRWPGSRATG